MALLNLEELVMVPVKIEGFNEDGMDFTKDGIEKESSGSPDLETAGAPDLGGAVEVELPEVGFEPEAEDDFGELRVEAVVEDDLVTPNDGKTGGSIMILEVPLRGQSVKELGVEDVIGPLGNAY